MAGIYIHIPFCRSRCAYCDFFSTTREADIERYVNALCREIEGRRNELSSTRIRTIYLGGGTPSLLTSHQLRQILDTFYDHYTVDADAEVTMEMNPDDVGEWIMDNGPLSSKKRLTHQEWEMRDQVNRVSLGIQTFQDDILRIIRRRHDSATAIQAVKTLQAAGFDNISIDLIYGLPGQTMAHWERDLGTAFSLDIQHLSAYALSYEPGTPLTRQRDAGHIHETPEEMSVAMFERLCQYAHDAGFEHYEISNFALPHRHSRHNSSYWTGDPYLGFGPAAHSYDGDRIRRANRPDLDAYIAYWLSSSQPNAVTCPDRYDIATAEHLSPTDIIDEAIMCGLRTAAGIDLSAFSRRFGQQRLYTLLRAASSHIAAHRLLLLPENVSPHTHLRIAEPSWMVADDIMSDLMT